MAKMNGLHLKKLTKLIGDEEHKFFMADVYLKNKKLFKWAQNYYSYAPCFIIPYDHNIDMIKLWDEIRMKNDGVKDTLNCSSDIQALWKKEYSKESINKFLEHLALLTDWEKIYKRRSRKYGEISLGIVTNGIETFCGTGAKNLTVNDYKAFIKTEEPSFDNGNLDYYYFQKLDDFNLFEDIEYNNIFMSSERKSKNDECFIASEKEKSSTSKSLNRTKSDDRLR